MFCFIISTINLDETVKILYNYDVDDLQCEQYFFHMGCISVQHIKSDTIHLVSYSLDCHMQSFVQTLTLALGENNLHVLTWLPHVAPFVFPSTSAYNFV